MCGIAGVVSATRESNITEAVVRHMCDQIIYRGPDEEGIYVEDGAGLGMRRLSIIDLSGGHQPVFNEDRSAWIVFNGEIYNFPELRPELEKRGHRFYTKSDTEVIIHLYEEMGAECVQKLRGMFSLAIYDKTKRKLVLARDRLGKKPLHYALLKDKLYFGSEIKSILAVAPELAEVNAQGLLEYLYYGYVPDPITAFTGIQKLPPGHLLEFENGKIQIRQYWDLPQYNTHTPKSEEECLEELEASAVGSDAHPSDLRCAAGSVSQRRHRFFHHRGADGARQFRPGENLLDRFHKAGFQRGGIRAHGCEQVWHRSSRDDPGTECRRNRRASDEFAGRAVRRLLDAAYILRFPDGAPACHGGALRRRRRRDVCRIRPLSNSLQPPFLRTRS